MASISTLFEIEREGDYHTADVSIRYVAADDPVNVHDHDHPAYSDPGSGEEFEIIRAVIAGTDKDVEFTEEELEELRALCRDIEAADSEPDPDEAYEYYRHDRLEDIW